MQPCKAMTDTLAPVERTNWMLSAWNSTLDRNDVPSAWLHGQDHLWATSHLVSSPGEVFPPPWLQKLCGAPEISHNKGNGGGFTKMFFRRRFTHCAMAIPLILHSLPCSAIFL